MEKQAKREKDSLRQALRELTENLPESYITRSDRGIQRNLLSLEAWKQAQSVFIYVSIGREPDTRGMIRAALSAGKTLAVPRTLAGGHMKARVITSLNGLRPGRFGILEPSDTAPILTPEAIDLAVVPCIAADRHGYRLGHGGGYYDRYLATVRCATACLCRDRLLQTALPHNEFDIRVDSVITEQELIHRW